MTETKAITIQDALKMVRGAKEQISTSKQRIKVMQQKETDARNHSLSVETNIIFAVDATASREQFWNESMAMQNNLFSVIKGLDLNLNVQLVSYGGLSSFTESSWHNSASMLKYSMEQIKCNAGGSQIGKVLQHTLSATSSKDVHALVFVGDSCEEKIKKLIPLAEQLKDKKVFPFIFDDGKNSTARNSNTEKAFQAMADSGGGVCASFSIRDMSVFREYFKVASAIASRNTANIEHARRTIRTTQGKMLFERSVKMLTL